MALSAFYKVAIDLVDDSILLASVEDEPGYEYAEFSYTCTGSTYTIRGGSFIACEHGAAHLLEAMGFRFFSPSQEFWCRNDAPIATGTLPTNLSQTKTQFWMPYCSVSPQYGNTFETPPAVAAWRDILDDALDQWRVLVGWGYQPFPSGHRAGSVVSAFSQWFNANPQCLRAGTVNSPVVPGRTNSFALNTMTEAEKDTVATLAAAYLLGVAQNPLTSLAFYGRTEYDGVDGDLNSSDEYFAHAVLVCQKVRAGVAALNTYGYGSHSQFNAYGAYSGIANAQLGVYAYAQHKNVPSFDVRPYIYVGVALGFSDPVTWVPKMTAHQNNSVTVMARDYLDPHQYTLGMPMAGRRMHSGYPDSYDDYYAAGCRGMQGGDWNCNYMLNLVSNRHMNMKLRTGTYTYAQARDDVVNGIFDGDAGVTAFYDYLMDPTKSFQRFSLYDLMLLVDAMIDSWYKTYFEQLMTVAAEYTLLPTRPETPVTGDAYDLALTTHLKHTTGMALSQIFHSYGHIRRLAGNGNTPAGGAYGHLHYKNPNAVQFTDYVIPTHAEYLAAKAALLPLVDRAADLDDSDLIVMHGLTSLDGSSGTATGVRTIDGRSVVTFSGPGTITTTGNIAATDENGDIISVPAEGDPVSYGDEIVTLQSNGDFIYAWSGGTMFVSCFPTVRIEQSTSPAKGSLWAYIPNRCAGEVRGETQGYIRLHDNNGMVEILPSTAQDNSAMNNIGPGQVRWDQASTGFGMLTNACTLLSTDSSKAMIPVTIAEEDFPNLIKINKV